MLNIIASCILLRYSKNPESVKKRCKLNIIYPTEEYPVCIIQWALCTESAESAESVVLGKLAEEHPATSTTNMKPERKEQVEKAFAKADKDSSGTLSVAEFKVAFEELAETDDDREQAKNEGFIQVMMASVDGNGGKTLTIEELIKLMDQEMDYELMLKNLIMNADKDGDGLLSADELRSIMMKMQRR